MGVAPQGGCSMVVVVAHLLSMVGVGVEGVGTTPHRAVVVVVVGGTTRHRMLRGVMGAGMVVGVEVVVVV